MKNTLRWLLGKTLSSLGLSEKVRAFYFRMAGNFIARLPGNCVEAAWIRRSAANEDFFPVVSDIDLTVLINDQDLKSLFTGRPLPRPRLMQDIQFLSKRFLSAWEETGGFRNYQFSHWRQIYGIPVQLNGPQSGREELAFELAYETHLVYKQLALKLLSSDFSGSARKDMTKLSQELNRIKLFWESGDKGWATAPRKDIPSPGGIPETLILLEELCRSLIGELEPPLNIYDWTKTVTGEDEFGFETAISFRGHPIFVLKDPKTVLTVRELKPGTFISTSSYLQMMKGIGIQEQGHLNRVAREHSYYRKFSCQRLAHDLIGAIILEPDNLEQLYFCFYNISHFSHAIRGEFPDKWQEIESFWARHKKLPWSADELERICVTYLDHIESLL